MTHPHATLRLVSGNQQSVDSGFQSAVGRWRVSARAGLSGRCRWPHQQHPCAFSETRSQPGRWSNIFPSDCRAAETGSTARQSLAIGRRRRPAWISPATLPAAAVRPILSKNLRRDSSPLRSLSVGFMVVPSLCSAAGDVCGSKGTPLAPGVVGTVRRRDYLAGLHLYFVGRTGLKSRETSYFRSMVYPSTWGHTANAPFAA